MHGLWSQPGLKHATCSQIGLTHGLIHGSCLQTGFTHGYFQSSHLMHGKRPVRQMLFLWDLWRDGDSLDLQTRTKETRTPEPENFLLQLHCCILYYILNNLPVQLKELSVMHCNFIFTFVHLADAFMERALALY